MSDSSTAIPINSVLFTLAMALFAPTAQAAPDWQINLSGKGLAGATTVEGVAGVAGVGFIQTQPSSATNFTFLEQGAYRLAMPGAQEITVTYSVTGSGILEDFFSLRFNSGSIKMFADPKADFATDAGTYGANNGAFIGSFSIFDGGVANTGLINLSARLDAGSLVPGYFFDAGGNDLADADNVLMKLGVTNNQTITPDAMVVSEIVCGMAKYAGPGCDGTPYTNLPMAFTVRDDAMISLAAVPEPASGALLATGLGLIPLAIRRRRPAAA